MIYNARTGLGGLPAAGSWQAQMSLTVTTDRLSHIGTSQNLNDGVMFLRPGWVCCAVELDSYMCAVAVSVCFARRRWWAQISDVG